MQCNRQFVGSWDLNYVDEPDYTGRMEITANGDSIEVNGEILRFGRVDGSYTGSEFRCDDSANEATFRYHLASGHEGTMTLNLLDPLGTLVYGLYVDDGNGDEGFVEMVRRGGGRRHQRGIEGVFSSIDDGKAVDRVPDPDTTITKFAEQLSTLGELLSTSEDELKFDSDVPLIEELNFEENIAGDLATFNNSLFNERDRRGPRVPGDFFLEAIFLQKVRGLTGHEDTWSQPRQNGNIKRRRKGRIKILGPAKVTLIRIHNQLRKSVFLFGVIYSRYAESTIIPPVSYINESEEILCHLSYASRFESFLHQPNHRNIPSQTIGDARGEIGRRIDQYLHDAEAQFEGESNVSVQVNGLLNQAMRVRLDPYVRDEINGSHLLDSNLRVDYADSLFIVDSITWDLAQNRLNFNIREAAVFLNLNIRDYAFGTVLAVVATGPLTVHSDGRVTSRLNIRVTQGERNAPSLAAKIRDELDSALLETSAVDSVNPALDWIRRNT